MEAKQPLAFDTVKNRARKRLLREEIRGHYQIDVQCINRHVTAGLCFEYLGSYESSEHALSNEVW